MVVFFSCNDTVEMCFSVIRKKCTSVILNIVTPYHTCPPYYLSLKNAVWQEAVFYGI